MVVDVPRNINAWPADISQWTVAVKASHLGEPRVADHHSSLQTHSVQVELNTLVMRSRSSPMAD